MTELTDTEARIEAAHAEIARLCMGGHWLMSIPARPGYDSDLIISDALTDLEAERADLTARLARVEALADEWELVDADDLRRALAAPTPTEVQP